MNEFTKEELMHLEACVSCIWLTGYSPSVQICDDLQAKLQFLIDNYDVQVIPVWHCEKCGHVQ